MLRVNDRWVRVLVILLPCLIVAFMGGLTEAPLTQPKILRFLVSVTSIILVCEGSRFLILKSHSTTAHRVRPWKRNLAMIVMGILYTTVILAGSKLLRDYITTGSWTMVSAVGSQIYVNGKQLGVGLIGYSFLNAIFNFFFLFVLYEVLYHYTRLRHTEKMKDVLEKEKLKAELQQLKGIVNPHFLFNNLNSLSSLIAENPAQAELFLDELTKVFRYLLRTHDSDLTTLANEIQFIQSYYHLLQTRYGRGIELDLQVNKEYEEMLIPPLTLQLLVENAVKHNSVQKDSPLKIDLYSAPGQKLIIRNNLAKKDSVVESTGIGLQNINARYRMLNQEGVVIEKTANEFAVIIPLIHSNIS